MKKKNIIVIVLLFCILMRALICLMPFDGRVPFAGDNYTYLHETWLLKNNGPVGWDFSWYGGTPFLKFYPPLSFSAAAFFSFFMDGIAAYKLVFLLVFSLVPLTAYLLFKEFFKKTKEVLFSTALFSLTSSYAAYASYGFFTTAFAVPFAMLFLVFFIRYVKTMRLNNFIAASVLLALTAISHLSVLYTAALISLIYLFTYFVGKKFEIKRVLSSFGIYASGFLLGSFWLIPAILENKYTYFFYYFANVPTYLQPVVNILKLYGVYPSILTAFATGAAGILLLYGIKKSLKWKSDDVFTIATFGIFIAGFSGLIVFLPFANITQTKWIMLMPIPATLLITKALDRKIFAYLAMTFLVSQIIIFPVFSQQSLDLEPYKEVAKYLENKEGRALYVPNIISRGFDYVLPQYNVEYGSGYFVQGMTPVRNKLAENIDNMFECFARVPNKDILSSLELLPSARSTTRTERCTLRENVSDEMLRMQNIRYVIINNNFQDILSKFESDSNYTIIKKIGEFTIAELEGSKYVQTDSRVRWNYTKSPDKIEINLATDEPLFNVQVRISEAWYPNWKADNLTIVPDGFEYMTFNLDELNGSRTITLEFKRPLYEQAGELISVISAFAMVGFVLIKRKDLIGGGCAK